MKNLFLSILIVLLAILPSCEEKIEVKTQEKLVECIQQGDYDYLNNYNMGSLCTSDQCREYQAIWKELLMEKNNLSESYFENHIQIANSAIESWNDGISFRICYKVKIDWAIAYNCDQFIIKINKDNTLYPTLKLPRDQYLSKENIRAAVDKNAFSSQIIHLANTENLKYASMNHALVQMINAADVNNLCSNMVSIDEATGHLTLEANAKYINEVNLCIIGTIDLINGVKEVRDTPCMIN